MSAVRRTRPSAARGSADLLACAAVLLVGGALTLASAPVALRALTGIPLVLLVPGYLVVVAAFGSAAPSAPARVALGAALSLALCATGVVALHAAGLELERSALLGLLEAVGVVALLVALRRRMRPQPAEATLRWTVRRPAGGGPPWSQLALAGLLVAFVGGGIAVARIPPAARHVTGSDTLWALAGADGRTTVGVRSLQTAPTRYRLSVYADGRLALRRQLRLDPGETWEGAVTVAPGEALQVELGNDQGIPAPLLDVPARAG